LRWAAACTAIPIAVAAIAVQRQRGKVAGCAGQPLALQLQLLSSGKLPLALDSRCASSLIGWELAASQFQLRNFVQFVELRLLETLFNSEQCHYLSYEPTLVHAAPGNLYYCTM